MPEPVDNRLIYEVLEDLQMRLANLEGMRNEVRAPEVGVERGPGQSRSSGAASMACSLRLRKELL